MRDDMSKRVPFIPRRDSAEQWSRYNPVLEHNELAGETDTLRLKLGDGESAWADLPYFDIDPGIARRIVTDGLTILL